MSNLVSVHIAVIRINSKNNLAPEDANVSGLYLARVDAGLPQASIAGAALDRFHMTQPIEVLDDFVIVAFHPESGLAIYENESTVNGSNVKYCESVEKLSSKRMKLYEIGYDGKLQNVVGTSRLSALTKLVKYNTGMSVSLNRLA